MSSSLYLSPNKFDIIAHRGGALEAPENTLVAFKHSFEIYKDTVFELDVHRTRDGEIVVCHDDTVDRTTDGHGFIRDMGLSDLKKLDAGFRFTQNGTHFPHRGQGIQIPTLHEVLSTYPQSRTSIEIKHANPHFEKEVLKIIDKCSARPRICLAAENHQILKQARELAPESCSGFSGREVLVALGAIYTHLSFLFPKRGDVYQIPIYERGIRVYSRTFLKKAHGQGKKVHVWTINDQATMEQLVDDGVDGIITDAPSLLLRVAQSRKKI